MRIIQKNDFSGNIIETVLKNRGIECVDRLLNPDDKDDISPYDFYNMEEAAKRFLAHVNIRNKIGIVGDADVDGFTSGSMVYKIIKHLDKDLDVEYFLHEEKNHGLTDQIMEDISKTDVKLVIIPDAGSHNDREISLLIHSGIDVIVLDHHEFEECEITTNGVIVNNFYSKNRKTNPHLVGAGMVFKFAKMIETFVDCDLESEIIDLAAIGQIGDSSDITDNEIRNIVFKGIRNINNDFIKELLILSDKKIDNIVPRDLSFSVIPMLNAVARIGDKMDKELVFEALNNINPDRVFTVKKKKKNKKTGKFDTFTIDQNLYEFAADFCLKTKTKQNNKIRKIMPEIMKTIDNSRPIAIGFIEEKCDAALTGLIASRLVKNFQKPVMLLNKVFDETEDIHIYIGSCRGEESTFDSFKDWCNETNEVLWAKGHGNAFGVCILENNFENFLKKASSVQKKNEQIVDAIFDKSLSDVIFEVDKNKHLFGGSLDEPRLGFVNIDINKMYIQQRGSLLTFFDKGVQYTMFNAPEKFAEELIKDIEGANVPMDFVGQPSINEWGGKRTAQIIVDFCQRSTGINKIEEREITEENISF